MNMERLERFSSVTAVVLVALAVAACAIRLRGGEDQTDPSASADRASDPLATKFAGCRSVTYEQSEVLSECRKAWAEKRRQFFKEKAPAAPSADSASEARPSLFVLPDASRLSPAAPSISSTKKE
jgi:conjugative transfer region protein TrbK